MSLDFQRIKEIKLTDVLARYKIPLRFNSGYAVCLCPLPTHKKGDTSRSFSINLEGNYFRCFSASCNEAAGCKGGDTINFVALMDGTSQLVAAKKLADWFDVAESKTAPHMEKPSRRTNATSYTDNSKPSGNVKYMASIDNWFDELIKPLGDETEAEYWERLRKQFKNKLVESFNAGKKAK